MKSFVALLVLVGGTFGVTPLASAGAPPPVSARAWKAAINDYYASGLGGRDSCAATVVARTHLPPRFKEGTAIVHAFDVHERSVCTGRADPLEIKHGMTDAQVAEMFGAPIPWNSGPNCWAYRASRPGTSIDGVRACFVDGVVSRVAFAKHL